MDNTGLEYLFGVLSSHHKDTLKIASGLTARLEDFYILFPEPHMRQQMYDILWF